MSPIAITTSEGATVTVYRPGGVVSGDTTSGTVGSFTTTVIPLYPGHGFAVNDRVMVGIDPQLYSVIVEVVGNTVSAVGVLSLTVGDTLVNLGVDSGATGPNYDGSPILIYSTPDTTTLIDDSRVTTNEDGEYAYYHVGDENLWELIRGSDGAPVAINKVAFQVAPREVNAVRYAHLFATSGTGTEADPWVTAGSNPVQAALNDLPSTGGTILSIQGYYDLGSADPAVAIPITASSTDTRSYSFLGDGQDKTVFNYSGTGTCFRYWQNNTGTPGHSIQSNSNTLKGFCVRQTGTARTGNGVWLNYARNWLIEDINFGTLLANRTTSDHGFLYGLRFDERSSGYQEVSDFMTVQNCRFSGNTHAFKTAQQSDNLRIRNTYFEANPNISANQDGLEITNSNGVSIDGCGFLLFNHSASMFGAKFSGDMSGIRLFSSYLEGNSIGIFLNSTDNQDGIAITGNLITCTSVTGGYGLYAGVGGSFKVKGLFASGNTFGGISTSDVGVYMNSDVSGYYLIGNHYEDLGGGTPVLLQNGSAGVRMEEVNNTTSNPQLYLYSNGNTLSNILLQNTLVGGTSSPSIYFSPDAALASPNIILRAGVASTAATLNVVNNAGTVVGVIGQSGDISMSSNITSGGHLMGLKATQAFTSNDVIATGGRFLIDLTNTSGVNVLTVAPPTGVDGKLLILRVAAITANSFSIADSGNVNLSAAWDTAAGVGVGDTLTLVGSGGVWYELCRSNN